MLQQALASLLQEKAFEKISVQDIAEKSTVNRATFYDHYADKFALLNDMVATRFHELLQRRGVAFQGSCSSELTSIVLAVCDFLAATPRVECERQKQMEPLLEAAVIAVVQGVILDGLMQHSAGITVSPQMVATTISWAIYGAAKEWARTPNRCPSDENAATIVMLVSPMFAAIIAE
jgi:AcrR family transcriptional regulator